jgi:hypothetical protein
MGPAAVVVQAAAVVVVGPDCILHRPCKVTCLPIRLPQIFQPILLGAPAATVEVAALHRHSHRDLFTIFPTLWLEALVAQVEMVPLVG